MPPVVATFIVLLVFSCARAVDARPTLDVRVVPHTHLDVGFELTYMEYYETKVQYIFDSVIEYLEGHEDARFIFVETAYIELWVERRSAAWVARLRALAASGRLEFVSSGLVMNDEACTTYDATINQMTEGALVVQALFGVTPQFGWQIDPFSASLVTPYLWALMGFNATVIRRIAWDVAIERKLNASLEFVWRAVPCACHLPAHNGTDIFTHILALTYSCPVGFNWQHADAKPVTAENVGELADMFVAQVELQALWFRTPVVMIPAGGDFMYANATIQFSNATRVIDYINANFELYNMRVSYATLGEYFAAAHAAAQPNGSAPDVVWPLSSGIDFMPYNEFPDTSWTGFLTSLPSLKATSRALDAQLRLAEWSYAVAATAAEANASVYDWAAGYRAIERARWAQGVLQHHDAITGTATPAVAANYAQLAANASVGLENLTAAMAGVLIAGASTPGACALVTSSLDAVADALASARPASVVLCSSLSWPRVDVVQVPLASWTRDAQWSVCASVANETTGEPEWIQSQLDASEPPVLWIAAPVPAMGCTIVTLTPLARGAPNAAPIVLPSPVDAPTTKLAGAALTLTLGVGGWPTGLAVTDGPAQALSLEFVLYPSDEGNAFVFRTYDEQPSPIEPASDAAPAVLFNGPLAKTVSLALGLQGVAVSLTVLDVAPSSVISSKLAALVSAGLRATLAAGPLNVTGTGGNLVLRLRTDLVPSSPTFYTDDSGLILLARTAAAADDLPASYYPAVTTALINNTDATFAVFVARTHGVTSVVPGVIELMLHRRELTDGWPNGGLPAALDDTSAIVDSLLVVLAAAADLPALRHASNYAVQLPTVVFGAADPDAPFWGSAAAKARPLAALAAEPALPATVHVQTIQARDAGATGPLAMRVMRLDQCDEPLPAPDVVVDLAALLGFGSLVALNERTLALTAPVDASPRWQWGAVDPSPPPNAGVCPAPIVGALVPLVHPLQIRTFYLEVASP